MAALLSSWWSGKGSEGEKEEGESKTESWSAGIGSEKLLGVVRSVGDYASSLGETVKSTVQEKTFIGEFQKEQKRFEREQRRQKDAAVPPWVGYNEEEQMKAQILELSADSRNVLRNPPPGVQFHFDFARSHPIAMATLREDSRLQKLRFELVPKKISEERFWHNYFYRVFLIKQSSQLSTLASAEQKEILPEHKEARKASSGEGSEQQKQTESISESFHAESDLQSPQEAEFASDALDAGGEVSRESVRAELGQLGVPASPEKRDGEEAAWEAELQQELRDLELQGIDLEEEEGEGSGEGIPGGSEEAWEAELQEMLDMHSKPAKD